VLVGTTVPFNVIFLPVPIVIPLFAVINPVDVNAPLFVVVDVEAIPKFNAVVPLDVPIFIVAGGVDTAILNAPPEIDGSKEGACIPLLNFDDDEKTVNELTLLPILIDPETAPPVIILTDMFCVVVSAEPKFNEPVFIVVAIFILLAAVVPLIKFVAIPAENVSNAVAVSAYVFLKYNKFAILTVNIVLSFTALNTLLSKIGNNSVGGVYDAIII
jgi:hypothetical protein